MCNINVWQYFVTLTLNGKLIDRTDASAVYKSLATFLHNMSKRYNLVYLLCPEYHADGEAIHIHMLCSGDFKLADSGKRTKRGQIIYNLPQWSLGFSTAVKLEGDIQKICSYITKYITKDSKKIFGKFYLASNKGLIKKPVTVLTDCNYENIHCKEYFIPEAKAGFKYPDDSQVLIGDDYDVVMPDIFD
ncbi:MAG: hypothetical protein LUG85_03845 [Clostridiales bacterium]|nr:hypothetical protein [Clostridiales bacterium]